MKLWKNLLGNHPIRLMDEDYMTILRGPFPKALYSFVIDDALCESRAEDRSTAVLRFWTHRETTILGIPDARLPYVDDGIHFLHEQSNDVVVRNSGGLAVALDEGVLNITLIIPDANGLSIHDGYHLMVGLITEMLAPYTDKIEAYEIVGSYCPGDYDLSIGGKKFAGISQRRIRGAASVQIYLDVCGNSAEKASRVRSFYDRATRNEPTRHEPPVVEKEKMASLQELTNIPLTIEEMKERAKIALSRLGNPFFEQHDFTEIEQAHYEKRLPQMTKRNEPIQQLLQ